MPTDFCHIDPAGSVVRTHCAFALTDDEFRWVEGALAGLTGREREVVRAICLGGANEDMADRLCIAVPTLRTHMMRIYQKMGATDKADVVRMVAANLIEGYRLGRLGSRTSQIVELKPDTGDSAGRLNGADGRKSSLAMTLSDASNRQ